MRTAPAPPPAAAALDAATLAGWLIRRELLDQRQLQRARQRQRLYGGTLDTAILELGLIDEPRLARALSDASGLPLLPPDWLNRPVDPAILALLDAAGCRRLSAQPLGNEAGRLLIVLAPGGNVDRVTSWAEEHDRRVRCYVLPLVRLEALWATLHGLPLPARHAALLGKLGGANRARRAAGDRREAGRKAAGRPPVETGPAPDRPRPSVPVQSATDEDLVMEVEEPAPEPPRPAPARADPPPARRAAAAASERVAPPPERAAPAPQRAVPPTERTAAPSERTAPPPKLDRRVPAPASQPAAAPAALAESLEQVLAQVTSAGGAPEQRAVWRKLRPFASEPRVDRLLATWRARASEPGEPGQQAIAVLGEVADVGSVAVLLDLLGTDERAARAAVVAALRTATCHDFGPTRWRWNRWWSQFGERHRVEWLLDALEGRDAGLRLAAARELEQLSGRYVGYHFDLDKRDRDEARRRWQEWWETSGKSQQTRD
jgi:Type II secretion system (T2SS), protein E, N-terminal domain